MASPSHWGFQIYRKKLYANFNMLEWCLCVCVCIFEYVKSRLATLSLICYVLLFTQKENSLVLLAVSIATLQGSIVQVRSEKNWLFGSVFGKSFKIIAVYNSAYKEFSHISVIDHSS